MRLARAPRTALLAALAAATVAAGWNARTADARARVARAERALRAESPALLGVSPDGRRLLLRVADARGYHLRVAARGGAVVAETRRGDKAVQAAWRPDGGAVAFLAPDAEGQGHQPYLWELATGRIRALPAPSTRMPQALEWDPAGARLAYLVGTGGGAATLYVVDAAGGAPPREVLRGVDRRSGVAWSPDGRRVAAARERPRGDVMAVEPGGRPARLFAARGAEVRDLAWRADGRALLAVLRPSGAPFFQLAEAAPGGTPRTLAAPGGDVSGPAYLPGGGVVYHLNRDGERSPFACRADGARCRPLGPAGAGAGVLGLSPAGDSVYLVLRGRTGPPVAEVRALAGGGGRVMHAPEPAAPGVEGVRVDIPGRDGMMIPAYLWRAPRRPGRAPAALIRVHGGPATQAGRGWDASVQYLVDEGVDVILLNYRGSTGYGAPFENAPGAGPARVGDVLTARDYAVRALGVPPRRVVLYGHSYGALLAARAAARDTTVGRVVLVSMMADDGESGPAAGAVPASRRVLLFQGGDDPLPPAEAREGAAAILGAAPALHALRGEGHVFGRVEAWARVYAAAAALAGEP
jgi:dipeptidyl aminopeptidase/acylaminoacyl peptidase